MLEGTQVRAATEPMGYGLVGALQLREELVVGCSTSSLAALSWWEVPGQERCSLVVARGDGISQGGAAGAVARGVRIGRSLV